ncbi:histidine kinase [Glaciecola sp. 1036]|uniref:histidine kinase n=1 Tax=Alteromonadaceae TaxID=72275 RepID=UPI003D04E785
MAISKAEVSKQVHDLRKPMNGISMQAELIKMLVAGNPIEKDIVEAADKIIQHSKDCSNGLQSLFEQVEATLDDKE